MDGAVRSSAPTRSALRHLSIALLLTLAAACGATPTEEAAAPAEIGEVGAEAREDASADATGTGGTGSAGARECGYDEVFAAVDGLEGQERIDVLLELAQAEGGLNVYTSSTDLAAHAEVFSDTYDLDVSLYRAQAHQLLQRVLQEAEAGYPGADVYETAGAELGAARSEGLLQDYDGPAREGLVEAALQEGWTGSRLAVFTVSWNTEVIQEPPTSYEDLADPRFAGLLMIEPRWYEWYMALSEYFTNDAGMDPEEVEDLFRRIAANATQITGATAHANFLASGEYGVSTSVYNHLVDELIDTGAPISRMPPVEPVVTVPSGIALLCAVQNPASALLFFEWVLTDAQELHLADFRVPTRESVQRGDLHGIETISVDIDQLLVEGPEWEERFLEVLREAQQAPA